MARKQHGKITPENNYPSDPNGRGIHPFPGFSPVASHTAREAISQTEEDRGRAIDQTGGTMPGFWVADGTDDWFYLGGFTINVLSHGSRHEAGEDDEISVDGLSGELSEPQPPKAHAAAHVSSDPIQLATAAQNGLATSAQITKLDGIESGADVTDAENVAAAGAVMESDYKANTILAADSDNTPAAVTVDEQRMVGRITGGNIKALTAAEIRALLNVEDGAQANDMPVFNVLDYGAVADGDCGTLTLDVAPASDWEPGDIIAGQSSGAYATVVAKLTSLTYSVSGYCGYPKLNNIPEFTLGEVVGVTGTPAKLADQGAANPTFTSTATENSTFFQAAIDAAHALGSGIVWVPDGIYRVDYSVNLYSYICVIGASRGVYEQLGGVRIDAKNFSVETGQRAGVFQEAVGNQPAITLKNLVIEGAIAESNTGNWYDGCVGLYFNTDTQLILENVETNGFHHGIALWGGCGNFSIHRCAARAGYNSNLLLMNDVNAGHITESRFQNSSSTWEGNGNIVLDSTAGGYVVPNNIRFDLSFIDEGSACSMVISGGHRISVVCPIIYAGAWAGIHLYNVHEFDLYDTAIRRYPDLEILGYGIKIGVGCTGVRLHNVKTLAAGYPYTYDPTKVTDLAADTVFDNVNGIFKNINRYLAQSTEPTDVLVGELMKWKDTDTNKHYLIAGTSDGNKMVELNTDGLPTLGWETTVTGAGPHLLVTGSINAYDDSLGDLMVLALPENPNDGDEVPVKEVGASANPVKVVSDDGITKVDTGWSALGTFGVLFTPYFAGRYKYSATDDTWYLLETSIDQEKSLSDRYGIEWNTGLLFDNAILPPWASDSISFSFALPDDSIESLAEDYFIACWYIDTGDNFLIDGDMEDVGIDEYDSALGDITVTKDAAVYHGGSQSLKIERNDDGEFVGVELSFEEIIHLTGWARGDGTSYPYIKDAAENVLWEGTTGTEWQYYSVYAQGALVLGVGGGDDGNAVWFDDLDMRESDEYKLIVDSVSKTVKLINPIDEILIESDVVSGNPGAVYTVTFTQQILRSLSGLTGVLELFGFDSGDGFYENTVTPWVFDPAEASLMIDTSYRIDEVL